MEQHLERRKHYLHTHIAGFTFWEGCIAFECLKIGTSLKLVREADNRHDDEAVALYYEDMKLGYIPRLNNSTISKLMDMGYDDIFEVRVCSIDATASPEDQVKINIYIKQKNDYEKRERKPTNSNS